MKNVAYQNKCDITLKYYLINFSYGLILAFIIIYVYKDDIHHNEFPIYNFIILMMSLLFFPLSKKMIKDIALIFSTREFWNRGFFMEKCGKSGAYAMYYLFCFRNPARDCIYYDSLYKSADAKISALI